MESVFLKVSGNGDSYGVIAFENKYDAQEVYEYMLEKEIEFTLLDGEIEVEILKFGAVDPAFVSYMKNHFCDYDSLKQEDLFQVK